MFYGFIMDKTAYKVAMCVEASLLILLMSTFYLTSLIGNLNIKTLGSFKNSLKIVESFTLHLTLGIFQKKSLKTKFRT